VNICNFGYTKIRTVGFGCLTEQAASNLNGRLGLIHSLMNQPQTSFIAYYRVSTERQGQSGLGIDAQRSAVAAYVAGRGDVLAELVEVESGRKNDRPQLAAALDLCRRKRAVLVIAKLDRLARSVAFISNLMDSGVEFVAVDMPQANRVLLHIMAAMAEHEREMISQRTKAALAAAKERGTKLGNPRPDSAKASAVASAEAAAFRETVAPLIRSLRAEGKTLREIAEELNRRRMASARGGRWHPTAVRRLIG
jgi:DNA invertase Pin-like site-specific DNA recombinase